MSIVRAVIYFQLLHLIAGLSVDHCDKLDDDEYKCVFNVSSANTQLSVKCDVDSLVIKNLDSKMGKAFDEDKIPSPRRLWDTCMHSHVGPTVRKESAKGYYRSQWNVGIKQFPDNYFCDGSTLIALFINYNRLNDTRKLGFNTLANCHTQCSTTVQWIKAKNNAFENVFNNSFCGLQGLTTLNMDSNKIKELGRDSFINLKSLESLMLSNNFISVLPPGVFRQQQNTLTDLRLNNNRLNSQSVLELKNLKQLTDLDLSHNQIDVLPNDVFKHMTQLTVLKLEDNLINTLQGSLTNIISLHWLSISSNNISVILSEDFQNNTNLSLIDFSHNPITAYEPDSCSNCGKLAQVAIANASLTAVPKFISKSTNLYTVDLSNNRIDQINVGAFDAGEDIGLIDLSFNLLTDITNVFTKCKVTQVQLNHNRLTRFSFTDFSSNLDTLSITHNNIHTIDTSNEIIHKLHWSLRTLNLSHNHLNEIVDGSFDHLTALDGLDLDHNKLSHISQNIFKNLNSLEQLFLAHNQIKTIEPNAFPSQLRTLHLDNNQLLDFNVLQLDNLTHIKRLNLHANKWSCECNYIEKFRNWLQNNSLIVEDLGRLLCVQSNDTGDQLHLMTLDASHCHKPAATNLNLFDYIKLMRSLLKYVFD